MKDVKGIFDILQLSDFPSMPLDGSYLVSFLLVNEDSIMKTAYNFNNPCLQILLSYAVS
jgi:hypothetical protein